MFEFSKLFFVFRLIFAFTSPIKYNQEFSKPGKDKYNYKSCVTFATRVSLKLPSKTNVSPPRYNVIRYRYKSLIQRKKKKKTSENLKNIIVYNVITVNKYRWAKNPHFSRYTLAWKNIGVIFLTKKCSPGGGGGTHLCKINSFFATLRISTVTISPR